MRVSRGSMMPSSQSRPVAKSAVDSPLDLLLERLAHRRERGLVERLARALGAPAGATIESTPASCLGPITAMRWLGQVKTKRGS